MTAVYLPALAVAFVITVVEMTEVVAVVFAFGADRGAYRHGVLGAIAGTGVVALVALAAGAALLSLPHAGLLWGAAAVLFAFGLFLFRSTLRTYRRQRSAGSPGAHPPTEGPKARADVLQFAGGFSVGAIEAIETVIVLIALAAAGYGGSAVVGSLLGGAVLVGAALVVHQRIRRIKVPTLKLGATSMLFTFAVFWGGEAAGVAWPGSDLALVPIFLAALLVVRGLLAARLALDVPVEGNG